MIENLSCELLMGANWKGAYQKGVLSRGSAKRGALLREVTDVCSKNES